MTRAVVVGVGSHIFRAAHLPALDAHGVEVVGVHDAEASRAEAVAETRGWRVFASLDELFSCPADLAVVCAPHPVHAELVVAALRAGLAVLVEKPLAARPSEIQRIARAAEASGRPVAVAHQHRFRSDVAEAKRLIDEGALGRMHSATLTASYPKRSAYYTDTAWRGTWLGEGGGVLLNQGLHDIDLLGCLFGAPERVSASLRTLVHPIETEDTADLLLQWRDGMTAAAHVTSAVRLGPNRIEVFGTRGALRLSAEGLWARWSAEDFDEFASRSGGHFDAFDVAAWSEVCSMGDGGHADVYGDLLTAMSTGGRPRVDPSEAGLAVQIIAAATLSSARGAAVALPLDVSESDALLDERLTESRLRETPR